jgi:hypothetical protein
LRVLYTATSDYGSLLTPRTFSPSLFLKKASK